jgi:hypothetical protein
MSESGHVEDIIASPVVGNATVLLGTGMTGNMEGSSGDEGATVVTLAIALLPEVVGREV